MAFEFTTNPKAYAGINSRVTCRGFLNGRPAPRRKRSRGRAPSICLVAIDQNGRVLQVGWR